jgi:hypothetical protein
MPWTNRFEIISGPPKLVHIRRLPGDDWQTACDEAMADQLAKARELDIFAVLRGWRNEKCPVLGAHFPLNIERAACTLFGTVARSVDMTVYTHVEGEIMLWISRRAKTKPTYPGILDSTVAGGVASGEMPFESLLCEAAEETTLPADVVKQNAKACGTAYGSTLRMQDRVESRGYYNQVYSTSTTSRSRRISNRFQRMEK